MSPLLHSIFLKLDKNLYQPKPGLPIFLFRIFFGFILCYQSIYYINIDYVFQYITGPEYLFKYQIFSFLEPLPYCFLTWIQYGLLFFSILFMLGILYRVATFYLLICLTYFTFIDTTLYNNHLYLFLLFLLVMLFIPADKKLSLKGIIQRNQQGDNMMLYRWHFLLLQFLIFITYFFGGIAKLNSDWLDLSLPSIILDNSDIANIPSFFIFILAYGGIVFDLLIVFILMSKRWFILGSILVLIFNIINGIFLFSDIGIFPLFMILSTILFLPQSYFHTTGPITEGKLDQDKSSIQRKISSTLIMVFIAIQLCLPIRHYFMTYNPEWTGIASRFIWHMKMQSKKEITFRMTIQEGENGNPQLIDHKSFLSANQYKNLTVDPKSVVQLSEYLAQKAKTKGMTNPVIKANIEVSFNGRNKQLLVNPDIDLSKIDYWDYSKQDWLMKLNPK